MASEKQIPMLITAPLDAGSDVEVYRFWWCKRLAVVLVLAAAGVTASWFAWNARLQHRLAAEVGRWRAEHLTLVASELQPAPLPDDRNALVPLRAAVEAYHSDADYEHVLFSADFKLDTPTAWSPRQQKAVAKMLATNVQLRALMLQVAARPGVYWPPEMWTHPESATAFWNHIWRFKTMMTLDAEVAIARGDQSTFLEDLYDLHVIRRMLARCPSIFAHQYAWNTWPSELLINDLPKLNFNGPRGPQDRRHADALLTELLDERPPQEDVLLLLQNESAMELASSQDARPASFGVPMPSDALGRLVWRAVRPAALSAAIDIVARMRQDAVTIRTFLIPSPGKLWSGNPPTRRPMNIEPAESLLQGFWPRDIARAERCLYPAYRAAQVRRVAIVSLAVALYLRDHDEAPPATLGALVPRYLPAIPIDPYDPAKGPLRYTTATSRPFIYSLGTAGNDYIATACYVPTTQSASFGVNPGAFVETSAAGAK